jgi:hypothetical protein
VYKISRIYVSWFFTSFYLESCIWPDAILRRIRQRNRIKFWANLGKIATETVEMIRQAFGEECMIPYTESPNLPRPKKARLRKIKVKSMLIIFYEITGTVHKKNRPGRPNSQFCILLIRLRRLRENLRRLRPRTLATRELVLASRQHTVSHIIFHQAILYYK